MTPGGAGNPSDLHDLSCNLGTDFQILRMQALVANLKNTIPVSCLLTIKVVLYTCFIFNTLLLHLLFLSYHILNCMCIHRPAFRLFFVCPPSLHMTTVGWVCDCGSGHTAIYKYRLDEQRHLHEVSKHHLKNSDNKDIILTEILVQDAAETFLNALNEDISADSPEVTNPVVFIGGTGGLRKLMEDGTIDAKRISSFTEALASMCGSEATFVVLTG